MGTARGRSAPPPDVRRPRQRERLLEAACYEFAEHGYRGTSSDSISRRAAMSKATFYEHFDDKDDCLIGLQEYGTEVLCATLANGARTAPHDDARARMRAATRAFLTTLAENPELTQVVLVELIGAGPRGAARRDQIMQRFADIIDAENAWASGNGLIGRFASPHDTMAVVGAIVELVARQVRLEVPHNMTELEPVIDRLVLGLLDDPQP